MQIPAAPHMTPEEFRRRGRELVDWVADYLDRLQRTQPGDGSMPVFPKVEPNALYHALPEHPPESAEPFEAVVRDLNELVMPAVTHWQHPSFFGYFPANTSAPAILADLVSTGLCINGFLWQTSPAITELEMRMTDWFGEMIGLPGSFTFAGSGGVKGTGGGVIHGTASEATLTALVAARERAQKAHGSAGGSTGEWTAYASSQAHSSVVKAGMVAGIGRDGVRAVGVDRSLAMDPAMLDRAIEADQRAGRSPCFVCATVGTTSTGAFDPLVAIAEVCTKHGVWLHIDAAYAGAACVCPEFRGMLQGVERADSFSFNPHKWLLTNFDCSLFWTRDRASLINALSVTPAYLRNAASDAGAVVDYRDWQIPLGRRFRALKLWFVVRHYGVEGLRAHIRTGVRLAERFESLVRADDRFEIPAPRALSLVCFRYRGRDGRAGDEDNRALLESLNESGRVHLTPTVIPVGLGGEDRYVLRMAIGGPFTREEHVRAAWDQIARTANTLNA